MAAGAHMRRRVGILGAAVIAVILVAGYLYRGAASFVAASGLEHYRQLMVFDFAASEKFVSFPVVLAPDTAGLILFDRTTGDRRIVYDDSVIMRSPFLSSDGKRLLFVRRKVPHDEKELISCIISGWMCEIIHKTTATLFSPVEIAPDVILYSSSPLTRVDGRMRADHHDLFMLKKGSPPVRLTQFDAYQLNPISVRGGHVMFSAFHGPGLRGYSGTDVIPVPSAEAAARSEIFRLDLADLDGRDIVPKQPIKPHYLIAGYSSHASVADNGDHAAFLNRRNRQGQTHFNLAIADSTEKIIQYIEARGFGFSRPAFVGRSIVANELLPDRYEVTEFALTGDRRRVILQLDYSVDALKALPRLSLSGGA